MDPTEGPFHDILCHFSSPTPRGGHRRDHASSTLPTTAPGEAAPPVPRSLSCPAPPGPGGTTGPVDDVRAIENHFNGEVSDFLSRSARPLLTHTRCTTRTRVLGQALEEGCHVTRERPMPSAIPGSLYPIRSQFHSRVVPAHGSDPARSCRADPSLNRMPTLYRNRSPHNRNRTRAGTRKPLGRQPAEFRASSSSLQSHNRAASGVQAINSYAPRNRRSRIGTCQSTCADDAHPRLPAPFLGVVFR
jgi:hypothetical protein